MLTGDSASDRLTGELDAEQRRAVLLTTGPVCILAGAGTGKTRTVTYRIAHAVAIAAVPAEHVLALTFTQRAAGELRERLARLGVPGVAARTFHSAALRQLAHFWPRAVGGSPPTLLDHKARLVGQVASRLGLPSDRATVRDLSAEIEWAKVSLLTPDSYPAAASTGIRGQIAGLEPAALARILDAYDREKDRQGYIDFEDVLLLTTGMLENREDVAREVRSRYRWFTVDEYQDVSAAQERLLRAWVGDRSDICVVGDPNQTIYTFAGADPTILSGFRRHHPDTAVIRLTRNYRSTAGVVAVANALLARPSESLVSVRGAPADLPGVGRATGVEVGLAEYDDEVAEARAVAGEIAALLARGVPTSGMAVLVRTNGQLESFEEALADRAVPYVVRGGERFFAREEVRRAITLLRGAAKAATPPPTGTEPDPPDLGRDVRAVLSGLGWSEEPPSGRGAVRQRWESLSAIVAHADRIAAERPDARYAELIGDLDARAAAQHAPEADGVTLATLHAAKGLEWDLVFLPGLVDGTLPISLATTSEQVAEEKRLFYVGVTRARDALRLSWSRARSPGGRSNRRPSRFLDPIRPGGSSASAGGSGRPATAANRVPRRPPTCRSCGAPLATAAQRTARRCEVCPPRYDEAVFEALRRWRSDTARAGGVPAYIVFSDATLEAVAEALPTTTEDLGRVPGVGRVKLDRYAGDVLAVLAGVKG
jgi:DNA helicase-2/ATP-dependent DNA helicase PcrA